MADLLRANLILQVFFATNARMDIGVYRLLVVDHVTVIQQEVNPAPSATNRPDSACARQTRRVELVASARMSSII